MDSSFSMFPWDLATGEVKSQSPLARHPPSSRIRPPPPSLDTQEFNIQHGSAGEDSSLDSLTEYDLAPGVERSQAPERGDFYDSQRLPQCPPGTLDTQDFLKDYTYSEDVWRVEDSLAQGDLYPGQVKSQTPKFDPLDSSSNDTRDVVNNKEGWSEGPLLVEDSLAPWNWSRDDARSRKPAAVGGSPSSPTEKIRDRSDDEIRILPTFKAGMFDLAGISSYKMPVSCLPAADIGFSLSGKNGTHEKPKAVAEVDGAQHSRECCAPKPVTPLRFPSELGYGDPLGSRRLVENARLEHPQLVKAESTDRILSSFRQLSSLAAMPPSPSRRAIATNKEILCRKSAEKPVDLCSGRKKPVLMDVNNRSPDKNQGLPDVTRLKCFLTKKHSLKEVCNSKSSPVKKDALTEATDPNLSEVKHLEGRNSSICRVDENASQRCTNSRKKSFQEMSCMKREKRLIEREAVVPVHGEVGSRVMGDNAQRSASNCNESNVQDTEKSGAKGGREALMPITNREPASSVLRDNVQRTSENCNDSNVQQAEKRSGGAGDGERTVGKKTGCAQQAQLQFQTYGSHSESSRKRGQPERAQTMEGWQCPRAGKKYVPSSRQVSLDRWLS